MILGLLQTKGLEPKYVATTNGGEHVCPCPMCGGKDRFRAWPNQGEGGTWYCRSCNKGGDVIEFLRYFDGLSYQDACNELGIKREHSTKPVSIVGKNHKKKEFEPKVFEGPSPVWQEKATKLLTYAQECLQKDASIMAWLAGRGIPAGAAVQFGLGYLPGEKDRSGQLKDCYYRARNAWGLPNIQDAKGKPKKLWIPRGIVIPAFSEQGLIRLRIRRPDADRKRFLSDLKYFVVPGSSMQPLLLKSNAKAFVIQEAELDAMATVWAAQEAGLPVGSISVGTNLGKPHADGHVAVQKSVCILVALDFDSPDEKGQRPGAKGAEWWLKQYKYAKRWPVAVGKDVGDAYAQGMDLAEWIKVGLPPSLLFKVTRTPDKATPQGQAMPDPCPCELGRREEAAHARGAVSAQSIPEFVQWQGAHESMAMRDVVLPHLCPYIETLRGYYAGKAFTGDLLIPCPKLSFAWVECRHACFFCETGHEECILNFVTSPKMLASR